MKILYRALIALAAIANPAFSRYQAEQEYIWHRCVGRIGAPLCKALDIPHYRSQSDSF